MKKSGHFYDCNRRSVLAARAIGRGHAGLKKFCGVMNLPPPVAVPNFQAHQRALFKSAVAVGKRSMLEAASEVRALNLHHDRLPAQVTTVTFDGTWMRRGFTSLFGAFVCMDWTTGRALDLHVSTKYCHSCVSWKARREHGTISQHEYETWLEGHNAVCPINTACSAPAMEAEAAVLLWQRSRETNNLEYHTFVDDGDSKSFAAVRDSKPYGDVVVHKEECIGHVQKRVGTRLRTLKKNWKGQKLDDGKMIGGQGRLPDNTIDDLQKYYGIAIRSHPNDLQEMAKAIWASLCHRSSSDEEPRHMYCPPGATSWCGWQRVQATKEGQYVHYNVIPAAIFKLIKPIYIQLASRDLLARCLYGATQNQNESLNGLIWSLCPKETFCGKRVVEIAAYLAVAHFNNGPISLLAVLREMGCEEGKLTERHLKREDAQRVKKAAKKSQEDEKKRRKKRRRRKGLEEQLLDAEGPTYEAGGY